MKNFNKSPAIFCSVNSIVRGGNGSRDGLLAADLFGVFGVLYTIKLTVFFFDSDPMFFMGDSGSYIWTALTGAIPGQRSFVYGFIIRLVASTTSSLQTLVFFQATLGAFSGLAVFLILLRYFGVNKGISSVFAILCVLDPIQLLYERFVLTESVALFLFSVYMLLVCEYIRSKKIICLVLLHLIGISVVSLRISFLPLILVNGFIVPFFIAPAFDVKKNAGGEKAKETCGADLNRFRFLSVKMFVHLVISLVIMICFHQAYRTFHAYLMKSDQPIYQSEGGFFLLADWSPVVKFVDFPVDERSLEIWEKLQFPMGDLRNRPQQRWILGGVVSNIIKEFPHGKEAEKFARQIAMNALKRDPFGILQLGWAGFRDYWDIEYLKTCMKLDRGGFWGLPITMVTVLKDNFGLQAEELPFKPTVTKFYFDIAWVYPLTLLCLPIIGVFALPFVPLNQAKYSIPFILAVAEVVSVACFLIERPTIRYLHSAGWLFAIVLGVLFYRIFSKRTLGENVA